MSSLFSGLTEADFGTNGHTRNGTSNGVISDTDIETLIKEEDIKVEDDEETEGKAAEVTTARHVLTPFELEGLWNLLGKLEELPTHKKCVPAGIRNAAALLEDMRVGDTFPFAGHVAFPLLRLLYIDCFLWVCVIVEVQMYLKFFFLITFFSLFQTVLKEHASDVPKLSYTGEPIVKWPERVSRKHHTHLAS